MSDWLPLREYLRLDLDRQIVELILNEPEPDWRAYFARHRERIVERLTDKAEAITLRDILAQRNAPPPDLHVVEPPVLPMRRKRVRAR